MTLKDLYDQTPVSQHASIIVSGDRVYVRSSDGTDEHLLGGDGELRLLHSDRVAPMSAIRSDLAKIKAKLGI